MEKKPSLDSFLLSPPVLVVVFTAALSFGVHQLTSQAVSSAFPHSFGELVIRLSILSSILLSITILFSWLLISGAIQATAIVLWDRGAPFHEALKLVGYCFTPLLLYSFFLYLALLVFPIRIPTWTVPLSDAEDFVAYLRQETVFGTAHYLLRLAGATSLLLLVFGVRSLYVLSGLRAIVTVGVPFVVYFAAKTFLSAVLR